MSLPKELFVSEAVDLNKNFCTESQIKAVIESVSNGETPDKEALKSLSLGLEQIIMGKDALSALGLSKRAAHRPKKSLTANEQWHEFYSVQSVKEGKKTPREVGLSRAKYQRLKKDYGELLQSMEKLVSIGQRVTLARDYIVKELRLKANETHVLDLLTCAGITHLEEMIKNSSVSEMIRIKDEILKLSQ